jgi:hypothetical protein
MRALEQQQNSTLSWKPRLPFSSSPSNMKATLIGAARPAMRQQSSISCRANESVSAYVLPQSKNASLMAAANPAVQHVLQGRCQSTAAQ